MIERLLCRVVTFFGTYKFTILTVYSYERFQVLRSYAMFTVTEVLSLRKRLCYVYMIYVKRLTVYITLRFRVK